jgi:hydrogenase maturation protein HypF
MNNEKQRLRVAIEGTVQGVGFRPFVYRLATSLNLPGWVKNSAQGVLLEIEGLPAELDLFQSRLESEKPPHCMFYSLETVLLDQVGYGSFEILKSEEGRRIATVLPDLATCPACRDEILDPGNRRYRYPFTNCTHCGPRFSILESLPYDRPNTSMRRFQMCEACRKEYEDPLDRRFHAQPNACPVCGPQVALWSSQGIEQAKGPEAIRQVAQAIRSGLIVGLKGVGGFHLLVDARNDSALARLRRLKNREEKPFALMFPALGDVMSECLVEAAEKRLLSSPAAPIVLLRRRPGGDSRISPLVAPGNPLLGVMLPYSPLHLLLLSDLGIPLVATSGNLRDEPICTDEEEAVELLGSFVDLFLVHNRPIVRPVDDSVVRLIMDRESIIRRARGYAPLPLTMQHPAPAVLALGGHLKNTVALAVGRQIVVSQHLGDLETPEALRGFEEAIGVLEAMYETRPILVACDAHPGYESTRYAGSLGLEVVTVQHHYAHVLACLVDNDIAPPVLGISWDGTGYGPDETVWGGEFLQVDEFSYRRAAHLRPFRLPGGEQAVREPRRSALGLLYELHGPKAFEAENLHPVRAFSDVEKRLLLSSLEKQVNAPLTSSMGRLFDAIASLVGLSQCNSYEGQAAMELEFAAEAAASDRSYSFQLVPPADAEHGAILVNWGPVVEAVLKDLRAGVQPGLIAAAFHNSLAEMASEVAKTVNADRVILSGGCFQNRYLTERTITSLRAGGFRPYWHQRIPPNDGGISVGQVVAAMREKGLG